jgi:hypothetical protein
MPVQKRPAEETATAAPPAKRQHLSIGEGSALHSTDGASLLSAASSLTEVVSASVVAHGSSDHPRSSRAATVHNGQSAIFQEHGFVSGSTPGNGPHISQHVAPGTMVHGTRAVDSRQFQVLQQRTPGAGGSPDTGPHIIQHVAPVPVVQAGSLVHTGDRVASHEGAGISPITSMSAPPHIAQTVASGSMVNHNPAFPQFSVGSTVPAAQQPLVPDVHVQGSAAPHITRHVAPVTVAQGTLTIQNGESLAFQQRSGISPITPMTAAPNATHNVAPVSMVYHTPALAQSSVGDTVHQGHQSDFEQRHDGYGRTPGTGPHIIQNVAPGSMVQGCSQIHHGQRLGFQQRSGLSPITPMAAAPNATHNVAPVSMVYRTSALAQLSVGDTVHEGHQSDFEQRHDGYGGTPGTGPHIIQNVAPGTMVQGSSQIHHGEHAGFQRHDGYGGTPGTGPHIIQNVAPGTMVQGSSQIHHGERAGVQRHDGYGGTPGTGPHIIQNVAPGTMVQGSSQIHHGERAGFQQRSGVSPVTPIPYPSHMTHSVVPDSIRYRIPALPELRVGSTVRAGQNEVADAKSGESRSDVGT